ncbi:MAG: cbb3-type cytochrome c oxidase subunit 3 [Novosphingobium sp.]
MSEHSTYDALRHFADSWGLLVMVVMFIAFALWPFRPGAKSRNDAAAQMIFKEDEHGE